MSWNSIVAMTPDEYMQRQDMKRERELEQEARQLAKVSIAQSDAAFKQLQANYAKSLELINLQCEYWRKKIELLDKELDNK